MDEASPLEDEKHAIRVNQKALRSQSSELFEGLFCGAQEREKKVDEYIENEKDVILIRQFTCYTCYKMNIMSSLDEHFQKMFIQ